MDRAAAEALRTRGYPFYPQVPYRYDEMERLTAKKLPESTTTFTYTATGQIETVSDTRGRTSYAYDAMDRLVERVDPDGRYIHLDYEGGHRLRNRRSDRRYADSS